MFLKYSVCIWVWYGRSGLENCKKSIQVPREMLSRAQEILSYYLLFHSPYGNEYQSVHGQTNYRTAFARLQVACW